MGMWMCACMSESSVIMSVHIMYFSELLFQVEGVCMRVLECVHR